MTTHIPEAGSPDEVIDRQFRKAERSLPGGMAKRLRWLRGPRGRWVRIPVAALMIVGGFLGFLPILGFWMVPLGLMLLALDVPFLKPPIARATLWVERRWTAFRERRRAG